MSVIKILIIRFSSIGDILLVTPLLRCLKEQVPGVELHLITKEQFLPLLEHHPQLHKIHVFKKEPDTCYDVLKAEHFNYVLDLHHNLRSLKVKKALGVPAFSFNKLNLQKFAAVYLKMREVLPAVHIVERYFNTTEFLKVKEDGKGLEIFIDPADETSYESLTGKPARAFLALVIGGSYYTKKIPIEKLREIISRAVLPVVLMGGSEDRSIGDQLAAEFPEVLQTCGHLRLMQSASLISKAEWVVTGDTGLMHIASAFNKKIVSVWGNTIPEFGMGPYLPNAANKIRQIDQLPCRPCSKLGHSSCPAGHFRCMQDQDFEFISELTS